MSEYDHELDDELLSAYLDDELSPTERAAVEARLCADPAAQQMLHQLGAVSQAVQGLPQETVGDDLRDAVLQKAARHEIADAPISPAVVTSERGSANGATTQKDDSGPTLTIGRTRRGWVWASLAVAAALLIMIVQSGSEKEKELPVIAERKAPVAADDKQGEQADENRLAFRELNEPAAPAAAPSTVGDDLAEAIPEARNWDFAENGTAGAPAPSGERQGISDNLSELSTGTRPTPLAQKRQPAVSFGSDPRGYSDTAITARSGAEPPADAPADTSFETLLDAMPQSAELAPGPAGGLSESLGLSESATTPADNEVAEEELIVVRIVAKQTALEGKEFDRLLERNGIAVDADTATDEMSQVGVDEGAAERFAVQDEGGKDKSGYTVEPGRQFRADSGGDADALLVRASPAAIMSCLESLHEDTANYVALAVDEATTANTDAWFDAGARVHYFADAKEAVGKQLAEDLGWTKYQRGNVPRQEKTLERTKLRFSYEFEPEVDGDARAGGFGGGYGVASEPEQLKDRSETLNKKATTEWNRGRARRLRALPLKDEQGVEVSARGGIASKLESEVAESSEALLSEQIQRGLKSFNQDGAATLPVLFVLTPEESAPSPAAAAPSPAAGNRAE